METIWQPALLVALAIALIVFGPSRLVSALALLRDAARNVLLRLRERRDGAAKPLHPRRPSR